MPQQGSRVRCLRWRFRTLGLLLVARAYRRYAGRSTPDVYGRTRYSALFMVVFIGKDYKRGGGKAMLEGVPAAALFAGFGLGSTFAAVAAIGLALSF